ncbi:MAG: heme o synthase [Thermoguttaceae bacterium]
MLRHYLQLARVRLTGMMLLTMAVGYALASPAMTGSSSIVLAVALAGAGLVAFGASTLNQVLEADRDRQMTRTQRRPLPNGVVSRRHALALAAAVTLVGLGVLGFLVNPLTSLLAMLDAAIYALIYTPLKTRSSASIIFGAICGALPPAMGSAAAVGRISPEAALLAGILFLWQVPHTLSLVWLHREDYARAGFRLAPVIDPSGRLTATTIMLYWLALTPVGLLAVWCGLAGRVFAVGTLLLGAGILSLALRFRAMKSDRNARRVYWSSIAYLPLLLALFVVDRPAPASAGGNRKSFPSGKASLSSASRARSASSHQTTTRQAPSEGPTMPDNCPPAVLARMPSDFR